MGNPNWRWGKQMEAEVNSISLWTKKWKYTPELPFGITEDEQSRISNYPWKIKGCSEQFKRNIIRKSLRPVVHLSVARVSLRAAIGMMNIDVKSPFMITVPPGCKIWTNYITMRFILYKSTFHLTKLNGAIWHCARHSFSSNSFVTKLPTSGITASTASAFTLHIMTNSQSTE